MSVERRLSYEAYKKNIHKNFFNQFFFTDIFKTQSLEKFSNVQEGMR